MSDEKTEEPPKEKGKPKFADFQRSRLSKLMANPDKPVSIPEGPKRRQPKEPPEFVRFYMGSSAGAGSEVFHVYRHLRRRENDRQAIIDENAEADDKEMEFQAKLIANKLADQEKTSKKRTKRLKKKQRKLMKKGEQSKPEEVASEEAVEVMNDEKSDSTDEETESHFTIGGR